MEEKEIYKAYNLDSLSDDQLKDISNTVSDILYKRRDREIKEKITSLKNKYEKKYFITHGGKKVIYVDTIKDINVWLGWKVTNHVDDEYMEVNIQSGLFGDGYGLFSDKLRMNNTLMYEAEINDAQEINKEEALKYLLSMANIITKL